MAGLRAAVAADEEVPAFLRGDQPEILGLRSAHSRTQPEIAAFNLCGARMPR